MDGYAKGKLASSHSPQKDSTRAETRREELLFAGMMLHAYNSGAADVVVRVCAAIQLPSL